MEKKLRPKYQVQRIVGDKPKEVYGLEGRPQLSTDPDSIDSPFVLMPRKDPAAFAAMITYARMCEPRLSNEIKDWLRKIAEADPVFGSQGGHNYTYVRSRSLLGVEG